MGSLLSVNQIGGKIEIEEEPTAYGGFANVFKGEHATHGKVALKLVSLATSQEEQQDPDLKEQVLQLILAEAEIWRTLKHPHIVKFLGLYTYNDRLCMVSLWAEGGCLMAYLRRNPSADRTRFIREIADALTYLHGRKIVHGDIKGPNVLLSRETSVLLCDFGMSKLVDDKTKLLLKGGGSYRWMAPELLQEVLDGDGKPKSFETDVFSFGMTIYEVLSGNPPLHDYKYDFAAASAIVKGKRPPKEPGNSPSGRSYEPIWNIADSCWLMEPSARPSMTKVFNDICNLSESFTPPVVVSTSDPPPGVAASNTVHPNLDGDALDYRAQIQQHTPLPEHKTLFTDMYRGVIPTDRVILISTVHPYRSKPAKINEEVEEAIKRHVRAWKDQPSHPAIIQYMGYAVIEGLPCVISEWHENGDVLAYLDTNRRADRNALIKQVAGGLLFLHTQEPAIVHGDVVSRNVAINNLGEAVLRNCALWSLYGDKNLYRRQSITSRFLPKLFHPIRPSQETDVYFFGELSLAPETTEPFVEVLEECCHQDSTKRPPMKTVCASLNRPTGGHNSAKTASVDLGDVPATHVEFDPQQTIATGSHCDVFVGADANKRRVGLKRYRITASRYLNDDVLNIKQDAEVWSSLHHDYILSFLGIGQDSAGRVYSATLWMDKGALPDYLRNNPDTADRPRLVSCDNATITTIT
ncbi:hypothetical protein FRB99_008239 [Tulasnella sp. 403]|nr:hypothetical protein FRB99_008239 [Tulasnella sp. 403]